MSSSLSKSANQFAADLFQCYLRRHGDKYRNLLLCPYLIYHSLAMMLVGAKGNTAEQLMKVLRISPTRLNNSSSSNSSTSSQTNEGPSLANSFDIHLKIADTKLRYLNRSSSNASSTSSIASSIGSSVFSTLADPNPIRSSRAKTRSIGRSSAKSSVKSNGSSNSRASSIKSAKSVLKTMVDDTTIKSTLDAPSLKIADPDEARHREFLLLTEQVMHGNHEFIHLASFIYLDKGTKRIERFKAVLRDYYETKPKKIDFDNVELMVKTVNEDVARTTENIYNDLLSYQEAQKLEKSYMLLVNAIFFRGFWLTNFTDIKKSVFIRYPSKRLDIKPHPANFPTHYQIMMMSKLDYLPVVQDEQLDAKVIRMPFEASDLEMLLLLPNNQKSDSTYLCERFSASKFNTIIEEFSKTKNRTVRVSMPVFCIDSGKISIQSTLVEMGAKDLFDKSKADMSGVCENKQVWLHKILHRCFIICDNRGSITSSSFEKAKRQSERSASLQSQSSSSGGQGLSSNLASGRDYVEQFTVDHPFMYIIFDSVTRTILLIGLYTDPSETLEVIHENQLSAEEAHQIYTEGVYKT